MNNIYPEAHMVPAMKIWKLPKGKESTLSEVCESGEYFLEEKIDGYWYEYEKTKNYSYLFSRNESKVTGGLSEKGANVPHIMLALDCLPADTIIIGEIYYPGGTSKTVTSVMGCLAETAIKRQENNLIHYYLHDIIMYDNVNLMGTGAEDRYKILAAVWDKHNLCQYDFLRLAKKVDDNLEEEISKILKSGGEGAVLKKRTAPYSPDKRPAHDTIKIKQMDTIDLVCMGFCDATKEYTGKELETWQYWESLEGETPNKKVWFLLDEGNWYNIYLNSNGSIRPVTKPYYYGWKTAIKVGAYDEKGNLVELGTVSSGLNDEIKQGLAEHPEDYLNRVCALDCMSISKESMTLRHPVFKCWRDDKSARDCVISEIFR